MRWGVLIDRRVQVVTSAIALAVAFLLIVFAVMVILKAADPVTFHFVFFVDILPWVTPVLLVGALVVPLYWHLAGILRVAEDRPRALAAHRFRLLSGSAFYLLGYTVTVWVAMVALRAWDPTLYHFNFVVDWLPAILPPWLVWLVLGPFAFGVFGAIGATDAPAAHRLTRRWGALAFGVVGAALLGGGGLLLNQGMYAGTQGAGPLAGRALVAFGALMLAVGGALWAGLLLTLLAGLTVEPVAALRVTALDRFRLARPRLLVTSFVWVNGLVGAIGLLMVALQYVDAQDFHWYLAKDLWLLAGPVVFGWIVLAVLAFVVPVRMAQRSPGRFGPGALAATGPVGPATDAWGYGETARPGRPDPTG